MPHALTPTEAAAAPRHDAGAPWARRRFSISLGLGFALLAVAVGLLIPNWISPDFLSEEGPVEFGTLWVYGAAVLCALLLRGPGTSRLDLAAAAVLLLAMMAREADLHKAMFGLSILKSRFYLDATSPWPVLAALAVLLPIVLSGLWLLVRHGRRWLRPMAQWTAPMVSVTVLVAAMVVAKILDRTPATLDDLGLLQRTPQAIVYVMLSLEEILEFALPVFAIAAIVQIWYLARRVPPTKT
jgi:hypothetical protein